MVAIWHDPPLHHPPPYTDGHRNERPAHSCQVLQSVIRFSGRNNLREISVTSSEL